MDTNSSSVTLTLEQRFALISFATQVKKMSKEQAEQMLVSLYEQMLIKDITYQKMLKHQWGLGTEGLGTEEPTDGDTVI